MYAIIRKYIFTFDLVTQYESLNLSLKRVHFQELFLFSIRFFFLHHMPLTHLLLLHEKAKTAVKFI